MDWLKGESIGNQRLSYEIWAFPVILPLNQSIDYNGINHLSTGGFRNHPGDQQEKLLGAGEAEAAECGWG